MTSSEKEKIVEKVKKLLALSKSANENEAALALENANKILMKYNLDMVDLEEKNLSDIIESDVFSGGRIMTWKSVILDSCCKLNNCDIFQSSQRNGKKRIIAVGKKQNIEVSVAMFEYVLSTMDRIIKKYSKEDIDVFSFRMGFARAIQKKVNDIIAERAKSSNNFEQACTALVAVDKALIQNFLNEKYPDMKCTRKKTSFKDAVSFQYGNQEGQKVALNDQISKGERNISISK